MSFLHTAFKHSLAVLLGATVLIGCKPDESVAPAPITPPVVETPTQYGTPFAAVPDREDAVIYQVNMRAFSPSANFAGVTARLDAIKKLNVNVLYLMPIYPVGQVRSVNSPYAVRDYTAVNPEFGTLDDLRALVDGAHARGMAVMLDWVPNHTAWDHPWILQHPDWYLQNAAGIIQSPPNSGFTDVAQLNFNNSDMRLAQIEAMKSWVYTANVDGFRVDYVDFVPVDFFKQANDALRSISTHKLLLLAEGGRSANFGAGFDYNFGFSFYDALKNVYRNGASAATFDNVSLNEYAGSAAGQHVVHYTTNHDVNSSDDTPVALYNGNAGAMSAFVVAALYKGVPMIYNGQEAGMTSKITFPFTSVKINWTLNPAVTLAYEQLLAARARRVALRRGTMASYHSANVCAFTKTLSSFDKALVLVNVRAAPQQYTLPAELANSVWANELDTMQVVRLGSQVSLPAYGYMVLRK